MSKPKSVVVGKVLGCEIRVVTTADGKKHFESECLDNKARDELAAVFEEEAILRINPKMVLDDTPPVKQVVFEVTTEPAQAGD